MAILRKLLILLFILNISLPVNKAIATDYSDSDIKSVFLYRLLYFIEWPEAKQPKQNINICVVGDNIFSKTKENLEAKQFDNKPIRLIATDNKTLLSHNCSIVFISESEKASFSKTLALVKAKPILTVSDIPQFAKNGGMIGFASFNSSIKLEINLNILSESIFKIDPNLLEAALHVY